MYRVLLEGRAEAPFLGISPPPPSSSTSGVDNRISPSILLIIIILAVIFFISGLLHLLVRFLLRPSIRDPEDADNVTALQGQLQQLFHLHDSGVDQSFIDTLPIFLYKAIIGLKNPFDCAVCLCEFEADDKLRLLPKCSHAFHLECIDTWLLSHSTCPLCRGSLIPDCSSNDACPIVLVLESGSESSREVVADREAIASTAANSADSQVVISGEEEFGSFRNENSQKSVEIGVTNDVGTDILPDKVVPVKLGKFRNVDGAVAGGEGTSTNSSVDGRRCFSMGSFEYVLDETSSLQVPIRPPSKKQAIKKLPLPSTPGHRAAMSDCDCHSTREGFNGFEINGSSIVNVTAAGAAKVERSKRESFSVSKIWLRGKKEKAQTGDTSRRAFSFRLPLHRAAAGDDSKPKGNTSRRAGSEIDLEEWVNHSEFGCDEDAGSCRSLESQPNPPSFARRTLLWLVGRQNKVVHSSSTPSV
ncbi:RING-H2 finger protein ATL13-like [Aristolochia californica]|uniref:RING-H2 finger protein ATL13-like n=1 Tax=Aristolochia californica TaxID=171875 RepID=UPI0035DFE820